jgi:hypothetical protein
MVVLQAAVQRQPVSEISQNAANSLDRALTTNAQCRYVREQSGVQPVNRLARGKTLPAHILVTNDSLAGDWSFCGANASMGQHAG